MTVINEQYFIDKYGSLEAAVEKARAAFANPLYNIEPDLFWILCESLLDLNNCQYISDTIESYVLGKFTPEQENIFITALTKLRHQVREWNKHLENDNKSNSEVS